MFENCDGYECFFMFPEVRQRHADTGIEICQYLAEVRALAITTQPERWKEHAMLLEYTRHQCTNA